ncbi:subclass B3 metallo-beta-lactamase [Sphingomonas ginkgonis]|uniref:beta-lactamase n=1 Tax=Sphingomonas ginkgonis TaxID=2315330 RepID=A0A429V7R4_9SPHN|nr:subclass B3 metallo-beta-lactamase [Sphingomonas ginkgonis]RST29959.1 subclass B3 metallo-beta-lactamase [Sphingomonas ginkgonis]
MFASLLALLLAMQQITVPLGKVPPHPELPRAPIEQAGPAWAAECGTSTDWEKPAPPVRLHANTYYVGTCGIASILIVGAQGNVLIDGGTEADADLIADNIRELGFRLRDIRYILVSHEHADHVGGVARLQKLSGAAVVASAAAARVLETGQPARDDPQFGTIKPFPPVRVERVVRDGDSLVLDNLRIDAIATPGHTAGATSWRWEACDGAVCRTMVYADSLSPVSGKDYRFSDHPAYVAAFRASLAKLAASRCEILLTPHPDASQFRERIAAGKPLLDEGGCKAYAAKRGRDLDERLAREAVK